MSRKNSRLNAVFEHIDSLSVRERVLIFLSLLAALFVMATQLIMAPLATTARNLEKAVTQHVAQTTTLELRVRELSKGGLYDPAMSEPERIRTLNKRLREIDSELARFTAGLVSPKEMARVAARLLKENSRLQLVKMESLVPAPLMAQDEQRPQAGAPQFEIYRHGVRLEFRGSYQDILAYITRLEKLPWKFFWAEINLELERHPTSRVTLVLYTVSLEKAWIGT